MKRLASHLLCPRDVTYDDRTRCSCGSHRDCPRLTGSPPCVSCSRNRELEMSPTKTCDGIENATKAANKLLPRSPPARQPSPIGHRRIRGDEALRRSQAVTPTRRGSFQPGRGKWHV